MKKPHLTKVKNILQSCSDKIQVDSIATNGLINFDKLEKNQIFQEHLEQLKAIGVTGEYLRSKGLVSAMLFYSRFL